MKRPCKMTVNCFTQYVTLGSFIPSTKMYRLITINPIIGLNPKELIESEIKSLTS